MAQTQACQVRFLCSQRMVVFQLLCVPRDRVKAQMVQKDGPKHVARETREARIGDRDQLDAAGPELGVDL